MGGREDGRGGVVEGGVDGSEGSTSTTSVTC